MTFELSPPKEWTTFLEYQFARPGANWKDGATFGSTIETTTIASVTDYDAVLIGEPYDRGNTSAIPGARFGPGEVRSGLANTKTRNLANGSVTLDVADLGDLSLPQGKSNQEFAMNVREFTETVHEWDVFPIFIGGDHSLTYANCAPLLETDGAVGIINIDSHDDLKGNVDGEPHSGSNFRNLCDEGLDQYTMLGANQFGVSDASYEVLEAANGAIVTDEEVGDDPEGAARKALNTMDGIDAIYVSLDIDVLEVPFAPGTSAPYPGGILPRELFRMLRQLLIDERVVAFDVVEVANTVDHKSPQTAEYGGAAIAHALSGLEQRSEMA